MTTQPEPEFRDRSTGLVLFGIAEIMLGGLCALAVPLVLIGQIFARRGPDMPHPPSILPVFAIYATAAVTLIWLGIGSILARRWARTLLLCLSGTGLGVGAIGSVFFAFIMPRIFENISERSPHPLEPAALAVMKVVMIGTITLIYIVIPGVLFLFYRSPHVKRTCEVRDPVERWTDRCPPAVLSLCLLYALGSVVVLGMLGGYRALPFFGMVLTGWARSLFAILLAGLLMYMARGMYLLRMRAWWVALAALFVSFCSQTVTFCFSDIGDLYRRMGLDERAAAFAGQLTAIPALKWLLPFSILPWLIWLIYVRRYFVPREAPPVITEGSPPPLEVPPAPPPGAPGP
jgi:hypothetical protein